MNKSTCVTNGFVRHTDSHFTCNLYADYAQMCTSILDFSLNSSPYHLFNISPCMSHIDLKRNVSQIILIFPQNFISHIFRLSYWLCIHLDDQGRNWRYLLTICITFPCYPCLLKIYFLPQSKSMLHSFD